ncbi:MAG: hypothetical protein ACRDSP_22695 [Pseudonocardiaceae bacterium]
MASGAGAKQDQQAATGSGTAGPVDAEGLTRYEARLVRITRLTAWGVALAVVALVAALVAVVIASQTMLQLPPQAAQPQPMTTQTAGPPITLPRSQQTAGRWIPGGFPATPAGALAQLTALDEEGMRGGDPQVYARAYHDLSLPGAPEPGSTGLSALLTSFRGYAGMADTGTVAGLELSYQVTHGLIKGNTDGGAYTVVCVLGPLSVGYQGRTITVGIGDCQAMRWTPSGWRISPGALAAPASNAWPGSADAVKAGYRELS